MTLLFHMVKERTVRTVNPLHYVLNGLASKSLPFQVKRSFDLSDMLLQLIGRKMLPVQTVVPAVRCNAVIPDGGSNVDTVVQMPVFLSLYNLNLYVLMTVRILPPPY